MNKRRKIHCVIETMTSIPVLLFAVLSVYLIGSLFANTIVHFDTANAFGTSANIQRNKTIISLVDNRSQAFNANESQGKLGPADLPDNNESGIKQSNSIGSPELVAKELSILPPEQLTNYPINDISSDDLVRVLNMLSVENLEKTLANISPDVLRELLNSKLPQDKADEILNRLPSEKSEAILKRILP